MYTKQAKYLRRILLSQVFLAFNNHISSSPIPYLALVDAPPLVLQFQHALLYISLQCFIAVELRDSELHAQEVRRWCF